jgi:hypothetical protein
MQQQSQALQAIFTGADGGPMAALAPLISTVLGAKAVPINFQKEGKRRSVEIPSTWTDYGMHWDNSGKNGHYAPISWSNA